MASITVILRSTIGMVLSQTQAIFGWIELIDSWNLEVGNIVYSLQMREILSLVVGCSLTVYVNSCEMFCVVLR
jgi:hypothetical protein